MKNYFLLQRDLKQGIQTFIAFDQGGVSENEIVEHMLTKFGLYDSNDPYKALDWGIKIRNISRNLAEQGKVQKYTLKIDGDHVYWYLDNGAPPPDWLSELEEGIDWMI
jgi:hypothetical protein